MPSFLTKPKMLHDPNPGIAAVKLTMAGPGRSLSFFLTFDSFFRTFIFDGFSGGKNCVPQPKMCRLPVKREAA